MDQLTGHTALELFPPFVCAVVLLPPGPLSAIMISPLVELDAAAKSIVSFPFLRWFLADASGGGGMACMGELERRSRRDALRMRAKPS